VNSYIVKTANLTIIPIPCAQLPSYTHGFPPETKKFLFNGAINHSPVTEGLLLEKEGLRHFRGPGISSAGSSQFLDLVQRPFKLSHPGGCKRFVLLLGISNPLAPHCFLKAPNKERISLEVCSRAKLPTAWRITANTAKRVMGEQRTTLFLMALSRMV